MRRLIWILLAAISALAVGAILWLGPFAQQSKKRENALTIYGTANQRLLAPVIRAYRRSHPRVTIRYVSLSGAEIYRRAVKEVEAGNATADILFSAAMDLEVKLVNDGYATPHHSPNANALPPWARWRHEVFGIAFEPAAMVFNRNLMAGRPVPQSRSELLNAINADPDFWRGKVGAYDIRREGVGYLLTSEESRQASDFGALMKAFGTAGVKLEAGGGKILQDVAKGDLAMGYNLLGSNVRRMVEAGASLTAVYPRDFTLAVLRTVMIPRNAPHPTEAHAFLEFLLSTDGQAVLARDAGLDPIRDGGPVDGNGAGRFGVFRPIALGPRLLVYLDPHKRRRMIDNWQALVSREGTEP